LDDKPGGGVKKGRPRIRWTDVDELYLRNMEQEIWTEQWASVVGKAKGKLKESLYLEKEEPFI